MKLEEMEKIIELCNKIGIKTLGELKTFVKYEQGMNETIIEMLERIIKNLENEGRL